MEQRQAIPSVLSDFLTRRVHQHKKMMAYASKFGSG